MNDFVFEKNRTYMGDCLDIMSKFPNNSVDMVLCDLPYGTTQNKWDSIIPLNDYYLNSKGISLNYMEFMVEAYRRSYSFEKATELWNNHKQAGLWTLYNRLLKPHGVVALTASQPFTSTVVNSNKSEFRHEWIWIKNRGSNFANTVREPFKEHESVLIFSKGRWVYNKQMQVRTGTGLSRVKYDFNTVTASENYMKFERASESKGKELRVPSSWQKFNTDTSGLHPTIKPVPLFEYLIKTYTNEGDVVLDNCAGSGTLGEACINTNRDYIMIEKEQKYFDVITNRISNLKTHTRL